MTGNDTKEYVVACTPFQLPSLSAWHFCELAPLAPDIVGNANWTVTPTAVSVFLDSSQRLTCVSLLALRESHVCLLLSLQ